MAKFVIGTLRGDTVCSRTTRKPHRSKKGRMMLASVKIHPRHHPRAAVAAVGTSAACRVGR